jgi:8-oxo-dGTP diphosphatase
LTVYSVLFLSLVKLKRLGVGEKSYHIRVRACSLIIENDAVLLVEFSDENGIHYNLPAGGTEPGESVIEAVRREASEEASVDVEVGPLAFVYEYAPHLEHNLYGATHSIHLMFDCKIKPGQTPQMSDKSDKNQSGVKWIPLNQLNEIVLYPNIRDHILEYANHKRNIDLIEESRLQKYSFPHV